MASTVIVDRSDTPAVQARAHAVALAEGNPVLKSDRSYLSRFGWDGDVWLPSDSWTATGRLSPKNGRMRPVCRYIGPSLT